MIAINLIYIDLGGFILTAKIIDGKAIAEEIRSELKNRVEQLKSENIVPGLAVILVGNDPASDTYVRMKAKACARIGIYSEVIRLSEYTTETELLGIIDQLNIRNDIHGILVQLPLPPQINEQTVIDQIQDNKDVDGFTPHNVGNLVIQSDAFIPCTPLGIIELIKRTGTNIVGKHAVIVGRSNIVGKPTAFLLLQENATVTICHSKTKNLSEITKLADILIAAVGKPKTISGEHVKSGAIVIDVGVNKLPNGQLVGDVDFEEVKEIASYITPVPKGVGPMTITMLLYNTIKAAEKINQI